MVLLLGLAVLAVAPVAVGLGEDVSGTAASPSVSTSPQVTATVSPSGLPSSTVSVTIPESNWEALQRWLRETVVPKAVDAAVPLAVGGLATFLVGLWTAARAKARSIRWDWPRLEEDRTHTILLLGSSFTGKTTLVKFMFGFPTDQRDGPKPETPTENLHLFTMVHETKTPAESRSYRFDIVDYRGGEPGQLTKEWPAVAALTRHREATAVILVLDLFDTENDDHRERGADEAHIQAHVRRWTPDLLKAIAGVVGRAPSLVVLFINKADLLENVTLGKLGTGKSKVVEALLKELKPVENALQSAFSGHEVITVIGSLLYGVGINSLLAKLRDTAERVR